MLVRIVTSRDARRSGRPERLGDALGGPDRVVDVVDVLEEDAELVATEAGHRVGGPERPTESLADGLSS